MRDPSEALMDELVSKMTEMTVAMVFSQVGNIKLVWTCGKKCPSIRSCRKLFFKSKILVCIKLDSDGDGAVSWAEVPGNKSEQDKEEFTRMDTDNTNTIDEEELRTFLNK